MTQNFVANWLHINVIDIDAIDLHIDYLPSRITHQLFIDYTYTWCAQLMTIDKWYLSIFNNYWTRLSKISWFFSGEQINYFSKLKVEANNIDVRDTGKSQYFAITEFNNCFIIRSPSLFFNEYGFVYAWAEYYLQPNTVGQHCAWADHYL